LLGTVLGACQPLRIPPFTIFFLTLYLTFIFLDEVPLLKLCCTF
jgi:hypothetical protein